MAETLDLDAEYNNRAMVPEHPEIMAGWTRKASAYRRKNEKAEIDVAYGEGERQRYDFFPAESEDAPLAVFVHGGYWQSFGKSSFSHMAAGANASGVGMVVAGYTLCPDTTIGGIVEEMRALVQHLARRFGRPMVVSGHSAGGHLAAMMLATDWSTLLPEIGFDPVPAALPISGLFELEPLIHTRLNEKLGLDETSAAQQSPIRLTPPRGKRMVAVVGEDESSEFHRQTDIIIERWGAAGVAARAVEAPGANHFTVIGPLADPDSDLTRGLVALAKP